MTGEEQLGNAFAGMGTMLLLFAFAYLVFIIGKRISTSSRVNDEYDNTEVAAIVGYVNKHKPDIAKLRDLMELQRKDNRFQHRLEQEVIKDFFDNKKER